MCNYGILYLKTKEDISMKNKKKDTDKQIDLITSHIQAIMDILEIPITEGNKDTPRRIAKMYCKELLKTAIIKVQKNSRIRSRFLIPPIGLRYIVLTFLFTLFVSIIGCLSLAL